MRLLRPNEKESRQTSLSCQAFYDARRATRLPNRYVELDIACLLWDSHVIGSDLASLKMADDADGQYNNSNRAFIQAFIARSTLTFEEAKPLLAAIFTAHGKFADTLRCDDRSETCTDCWKRNERLSQRMSLKPNSTLTSPLPTMPSPLTILRSAAPITRRPDLASMLS